MIVLKKAVFSEVLFLEETMGLELPYLSALIIITNVIIKYGAAKAN